MNDKRARLKTKKRVSIKEEASTSNQVLCKIEKMIERLALDKPELQIRNPNFHGQQQTSIQDQIA